MNNGSYFSQYESPNIIIVPTMSYNPPSPKRKKLGNNIVVPIVNNVACEKQKLNLSQDSNRTDNSITCKSVDINESNESSSSIPSSLKGSWAANYLQSIGLDKKSSIWNRKIPRKSAPQRCVVTVEPSKKTEIRDTEITPTSTSINSIIENGNQLNIPNKIVTNLNTKDSNTNIKRNFETRNRSVKGKSKESKQSNHESKKTVIVKNSIGSKNKKTVNIIMHKKKNILKDQNKIQTNNIKKNKSIAEPMKLSGNHNLHIKTEKRINTPSKKDRTSKLATESVPKSYRQRSQNIVEEKSKIKSVVVKKDHVEERSKINSKIGHNHTTNDSAKLSARYSSSNYKEKSIDSKRSTENVTSINNIKVKKKEDEHNNLNNSISKNARPNTELKNKVVQKAPEVSNRTKTKEKSPKSKSGLKSATKTIKSPIKRKPSKSKRERKIKIVINLICNQNPNSTQIHETPRNDSNDSSTTCTVPNVDLDFLNDFDIDEIVESLDTCEKRQSDGNLNVCQSKGVTDKDNIRHNNQNSYKNNIDAIDLIKTLKGEEDDDLMRISIENDKDFLISKVKNNVTPGNEKPHNILLEMESQVHNNVILNSSSQILVKAEENEVFHSLDEAFEQSSSTTGNSNIENINKNINPVHFVESNNVNQDEIAKRPQETSFKIQPDVSSNNGSQPLSDDRVRNGISEDISNDLMNSNTQIIEEKYISPFVGDAYSSSVFNKLNTDSNKEFTLEKHITENINEAKLGYSSLSENKVDNNQVLNKNVENLYFIDQNEKPLNDTSPKKISEDNNNKIVNEKSTIHTCSTNAIKTKSNNKNIHCTNKNQQNDDAANNLKPEKLDNKCLVNAEEQEVCNNNDKSTKSTKDVNNTNGENDNITNNSICKSLPQQTRVNEETKHDQNSVALLSNKVKDEAIRCCKESQENRDDSVKLKSNVEENSTKNKQKDSPDTGNETLGPKKQLSNCDEYTLGNIKTKDDEQSVLEQGLLTSTGSKYSIISLIHNGRFSKIFKCKHPNGKHYALKMPTTNIKYTLGKQKTYMLDSLISDIPKENLFIVCLVKGFNVGKNWCFLMEYYPKNLDQVLSVAGKPLTINQIQDYARQLVMAVMVLRNRNMVHLDIKPKHILINSSNNMLKLCGFDNLCYLDQLNVLPNIGTVNYRAPEVIIGYKSDFEIDVWSTGLVLYEMATNKRLFPGIYNNDILYKQMCTLGIVPYKMIRKSRFGSVHFVGWKFMRKSGFKGQNISLISKFNKSNKLCDSIYAAYFQNWGGKRSTSQQSEDLAKINLFVKLLQKMLVIYPGSRLPIEFVYSNPFIYDAYSYQKW